MRRVSYYYVLYHTGTRYRTGTRYHTGTRYRTGTRYAIDFGSVGWLLCIMDNWLFCHHFSSPLLGGHICITSVSVRLSVRLSCVGMCGKVKYGLDSVFKKSNRPKICHPFRWFPTETASIRHSNKKWIKVTLLALNVQINNVLKYDRNRF